LLSAGLGVEPDLVATGFLAAELAGLVLEQLAIKIIIEAIKTFLIMGLIL